MSFFTIFVVIYLFSKWMTLLYQSCPAIKEYIYCFVKILLKSKYVDIIHVM